MHKRAPVESARLCWWCYNRDRDDAIEVGLCGLRTGTGKRVGGAVKLAHARAEDMKWIFRLRQWTGTHGKRSKGVQTGTIRMGSADAQDVKGWKA